MNVYQLTILDKDEVHIPAIKRFANKCIATYSITTTKDGTIFEFEFPTYNLMQSFKESLNTLNPPLF